MKKLIRETDEKRGIVQITVADERWYMKPGKDPETGIPTYKPVPSVTWISGFWPKGIGFYKWLAEHRAALYAEGRGIRLRTGAELLLAIFAESESPAAQLLAEQGMTREDALNFIIHGIEKGGGDTTA